MEKNNKKHSPTVRFKYTKETEWSNLFKNIRKSEKEYETYGQSGDWTLTRHSVQKTKHIPTDLFLNLFFSFILPCSLSQRSEPNNNSLFMQLNIYIFYYYYFPRVFMTVKYQVETTTTMASKPREGDFPILL